MRVRFLGTGTSHGVPMIGCDCAVCRSDDPRDKRLRSSVLIETDAGSHVLVDTTTDLREQALRYDVRRLDAVLFTHAHADHILGLDEVRRFNHLQREAVPLYGSAETLADIARTFAYVFDPAAPRGGGVPDLRLCPLGGPFCLGGAEIVPVPLRHGRTPVLGFRFGAFAYLTDCNAVPDASLALLAGVDVLVIDALRRRPHPTHFTLDEAVVVARRLGATKVYFTHLAHDLGHAETTATLPKGMTLAHDGLVLTL